MLLFLIGVRHARIGDVTGWLFAKECIDLFQGKTTRL
jgi:hypothetical protein